MKKTVSDTLHDFLILAVASLVLGLLLAIFPSTSGKVISAICALILIVFGGVHVVLYFTRKAPDTLLRHDFTVGLICLLAGIYLLLHPQFLPRILPTVLGLAVLADAIHKLQKSLDLVRLGAPNWWITLLLAVATGILGVVILANPFHVASALLRFAGIGLAVNGGADLWTFFSLRRQTITGTCTVSDADESPSEQ